MGSAPLSRKPLVFALVLFAFHIIDWKRWFSVIVTTNVLLLYFFYWKLHTSKPSITYQPTRRNEHIISKCPALLEPFCPTFWAMSGHSQSGLFAFWPGLLNIFSPLEFHDQVLRLHDGGQLLLSWVTFSRFSLKLGVFICYCVPVQ